MPFLLILLPWLKEICVDIDIQLPREECRKEEREECRYEHGGV